MPLRIQRGTRWRRRNTLSDGTRTYEWDAENRLLAANYLGAGQDNRRVEWSYDAFSRRVQQRDANETNGLRNRDLIWDGLSLIESRDATGEEVRRYYGNGEEREVPGNDVLRLYYTMDHLGSIREMADVTGAVVARYDYTPYGERTRVAGDLDCDFGFTGHYTHETSGIILAPYRAYEPETGRWLSRDPIEEEGGINLYGYVGNGPLKKTDKLGLAGYDFETGQMNTNNGIPSLVNIAGRLMHSFRGDLRFLRLQDMATPIRLQMERPDAIYRERLCPSLLKRTSQIIQLVLVCGFLHVALHTKNTSGLLTPQHAR